MQVFYAIDILCVSWSLYLVKASHDGGGFNGTANISLENAALVHSNGNKITCVLASDGEIPVTFTWHWKNSEVTKDPGHYFEWSDDKGLDINSRQIYWSELSWKSTASIADKKSVRGSIIYGSGSHDDDTTACPDVTLNIIWKPETASVLRNPDSGNILRDGKLMLTCSGDKGNPTGSVTWTINGTVMLDDIYKTDMITINKVQAEHDGNWTCYFTNDLGSGNESDIQTIDVKWRPESCNLTLNPDDDYINCMKLLQLDCTCPVKGKPEGEINWFLNKNKKTGSMYQFDEITIVQVGSSDAGDWECYYKNEIGMGTPSSKTVNVGCHPTGDTELRADSYEIKRGQTVRLECNGDPGSPKDKVLWKFDSTVVRMFAADKEENTWYTKPSRNGTWSCLFMNEFGNGTESDGVYIGVLLTYFPPKIKLDITAVSLTISIESNETMTTESDNKGNRIKRLTEHDGTLHYTAITLNGNGESISTNQSIDISKYTFDGLQPETSYNLSVFYHNNFGEGEPAFDMFTTKPLPVSESPTISRNLLTAVVQMKIDNPDSASEIKISICSIGETDISNCNTENTTVTVDFRKGVYGTFSKRYVNVSLYDSGVQVYSYGHNIDLALVVIILIVLAAVVLVGVIIVIIIIVIKKKDKGKKKPEKEEEEIIDPYGSSNPNNESKTGTGPAKALNAPLVDSVVKKGKPLEPIAASPADGPVYSKVDWSKKNSRQSLRGSPMSKKAIDKIMFDKNDGKINMEFEVSKKFTGDIEIDVCREGGQSSTSKVPKQHVRGTKNVVIVLPIKETTQDKYAIHMKFIAKGQMVQEVDLTYPYEQNSVHVTVLNDAYVTSGADGKTQEMPEYSEVNKSKKTKGPEMPTYSEVNKRTKKKKAAEEQLYEDVETKNQSSHNDRSTNAVSPSNAEVAVEGVPSHPPRKGAPKEGVMYAELDLNNSGPPRLLPRLGSKSPAHEPVVYADVRPG